VGRKTAGKRTKRKRKVDKGTSDDNVVDF
jgi:hypothetical protein